jgi:hypothetical protein
MIITFNILEIAGCRNLIGVQKGAPNNELLFLLFDVSKKLALSSDEERLVATSNMETLSASGPTRDVDLTIKEVEVLKGVLDGASTLTDAFGRKVVGPSDTIWLRPLLEKLK